jgi:hypothetical protein
LVSSFESFDLLFFFKLNDIKLVNIDTIVLSNYQNIIFLKYLLLKILIVAFVLIYLQKIENFVILKKIECINKKIDIKCDYNNCIVL